MLQPSPALFLRLSWTFLKAQTHAAFELDFNLVETRIVSKLHTRINHSWYIVSCGGRGGRARFTPVSTSGATGKQAARLEEKTIACILTTLYMPREGVISVKSDLSAVWGLLTSSYLNLLLLSVPLGYMAQALRWAPLLRFGLVSSSHLTVAHGRSEPAWSCTAKQQMRCQAWLHHMSLQLASHVDCEIVRAFGAELSRCTLY